MGTIFDNTSWYDWLPGVNMATIGNKVVNGQQAGGGSGLLGDAWKWGQERQQGPQIGANPYQGGYDSLIGQLQQQASGKGPSLAGNAYNQAHGQAMQDYQSMGRGGSAGAARMGQQNMGRANQGLAAGYSNARLQEQLAARQQLQGALGGASAAWFAPQQANLSAQMGQQTNMQQLLAFMQGAGQVGGKIAGGM